MFSELRTWIVGAVLACAASAAFAQDYTVATATGRLESRPSGATAYSIQSGGPEAGRNVTVQLPFEFRYYGMRTDEIMISAGGFILPFPVSTVTSQMESVEDHGQDSTSGAFPYTQSGAGGSGAHNVDGLIAPIWHSWRVNRSAGNGIVYSWTAGSAPERHFTVSWENVHAGSTSVAAVTFQLQLYEGSGEIVFAYSTTGVYPSAETGGYAVGLDSPIDSRFTCPLQNNASMLGYPGSDFVFTPRTSTVTGTLLFDKLVSDETGIGNSVDSGRALGGLRVELRNVAGTVVYGRGTTDADGAFSLTQVAAPTSAAASVVVSAENAACAVRPSIGAASTEWTVDTSVSLTADADLGPRTLTSGADANGDTRAALNTALACAAARAFATSRSNDPVPALDVVLGPTSEVATGYVPATQTTAALLRIGSRSAVNPDAWDDAVVTRAFGRHVLAAIAAAATSSYDARFDAVTDVENAFAEAFGYALWGAVSGADEAVDGTGASSAVVLALDAPSFTAARGTSHAGAVTEALFDLIDAANETTDPVDGTGADEDRWFEVVDAFSSPVTAPSFLQAWVDRSFDAAAITRIYLHAGLLPDDTFEPNDLPGEPGSLGPVGALRTGLVLTRFNEDWFSVSVPAGVPRLVAEATHNTFSDIALEIVDGTGAVVATGAPFGSQSRLLAGTGSIAAGTYRVRVRHTGGATIDDYDVQAYLPLAMEPQPFVDWTEGRPYDRPLDISGGVLPYTLTPVGAALPQGLFANTTTLRGLGTPTAAGSYPVTLELRDSGSPLHTTSRSFTVVIHPPMDVLLGRYLGVPLGRAADIEIPHVGGTPPRGVTLPSGALPDGLDLDGGDFRVTGTALAAGSTAFTYEATDLAGSTDAGAAVAVVCPAGTAKAAVVDLATGDAACGVWIDAVRGSTLRFAAKTAKKAAKRTLVATVLGPDQRPVVGGKVTGKSGAASGTSIPCTTSGRYFVILASTSGEPTQLLVSVSAAPPKKTKPVKVAQFGADSTTDIDVGALPGARLVLKASGDKKSGLVPRCAALVAPDGSLVSLDGLVKTSKTGFTLTAVLPAGGTWRVTIAGNTAAASPGTLTWSWTIAQPKGAVYSAD